MHERWLPLIDNVIEGDGAIMHEDVVVGIDSVGSTVEPLQHHMMRCLSWIVLVSRGRRSWPLPMFALVKTREKASEKLRFTELRGFVTNMEERKSSFFSITIYFN